MPLMRFFKVRPSVTSSGHPEALPLTASDSMSSSIMDQLHLSVCR